MLKGRKSAEVDRLATDLKSRFAENGCPLPFAKKADFVYQLGTRKVTLNAVSSKLVGTFTQSHRRTQLRRNSASFFVSVCVWLWVGLFCVRSPNGRGLHRFPGVPGDGALLNQLPNHLLLT